MRRHLPQAGGTAGAREGHLGHRPSTLPPYLENFASRGALPRVRDVSTRRLSKSAPAGYCETCGPWVTKCRSLLHRPGPWHDETGLRGWVFDCARALDKPLFAQRNRRAWTPTAGLEARPTINAGVRLREKHAALGTLGALW